MVLFECQSVNYIVHYKGHNLKEKNYNSSSLHLHIKHLIHACLPGVVDNGNNMDDNYALRPSAMPSEIVEALGIERILAIPSSISKQGTSKAHKPTSQWSNFKKRWSVTPTRQVEAPVEIKSRVVPKESLISRKKREDLKKKKPMKTNTAMLKLTRMASSKFNLSDFNAFIDEEDDNQGGDIAPNPRAYPSPLPFGDQRPEKVMPKYESSPSDISRRSEFFEATEWAEPNRSNPVYMEYAPPKLVEPKFIIPRTSQQPMLGGDANHYSHLTGGPSSPNYNLAKGKEYVINKGNGRKDNKAPRIMAHLPTNDDEYTRTPWDGNGDRDLLQDNDYEQLTEFETPYQSSNKEYYHNRVSNTFDPPILGYPKTEIKGKRKSPVFHVAHIESMGTSRDIESNDDLGPPTRMKPDQSRDRSHIELSGELRSVAHNTFDEQPRVRRSSSGHVSYTVPNVVGTPLHESPFADYTKHGLKENSKQSVFVGDAKLKMVGAKASINSQTSRFTKPPRPQTMPLETREHPMEATSPQEGGPRFRRSSSGHVSYNVPDTSGTPPHDSPFADYTKHGQISSSQGGLGGGD